MSESEDRFSAPYLAQVTADQDAETIASLRRENERLRHAIDGLRKFARVEQLTPEQQEGYHAASVDLFVMLAGVRGYELPEKFPPLGWGRHEPDERPD
ncbi:hypothetical protein [Mycobacteroides abscessus]|uniref:hypothetical protein n=1 Tax=Mycobacteroides abscessus TaxID=36809 RepID=UPI00092822B1|nr:hypothetical protein [Mycobacteroides abscessus]SIE27570.1 Uncharacterised protein [Mycobacteroides abscessus subsp. abscessus]